MTHTTKIALTFLLLSGVMALTFLTLPASPIAPSSTPALEPASDELIIPASRILGAAAHPVALTPIDERTAVVYGLVTDSSGSLVEDSVVRIHIDGAPLETQASRSNGAYAISLPLGTHRIRATAPGFRAFDAQLELSESKGGRLDFVLVPARLIPVRLWTNDGTPLADHFGADPFSELRHLRVHATMDVPLDGKTLRSELGDFYATPNDWSRSLPPTIMVPEGAAGVLSLNTDDPFIASLTYRQMTLRSQEIGQGVYPGNLDSFRLGDFDDDSIPELIFGNFDGFVHAMALDDYTIPGNNLFPLLYDEHRSPPLGWGIAALDVGTLIGQSKWIVAGDSTGRLWKMKITGSDTYGPALPFTMGVPHRFMAYLRLGKFRSSANDVVVQDEFHRFHLYAANGAHQASTTRFQFDPTTHQPNDDYIGMTGLPTMTDLDGDSNDELLVPCMDGFLRRVSFSGTTATVHTYINSDPTKVFHLKATLHCCLPFDTDQNPSNGYYVIVGAMGHPDITEDDDEVIGPPTPFLAAYEIDANDNDTILGTVTDPDIKNHPVAMEWIDESLNTFALASGNVIAKFDADDFTNLLANPPEPLASMEVPGLPDPPDLTLAPSGIPLSDHTITGMEVHDGDIVVGIPAGRIFVLDSDLNATRMTDQIDLPANLTPLTAQANLSLGWTVGVDKQPELDNPVLAQPALP